MGVVAGAKRLRWIRDAGTSGSPAGTGGFGNRTLFVTSQSLTVVCELCQRLSVVGAVWKSLHLRLPSSGRDG